MAKGHYLFVRLKTLNRKTLTFINNVRWQETDGSVQTCEIVLWQ